MNSSRVFNFSAFMIMSLACSVHHGRVNVTTDGETAAINALQKIADEAVKAGNTEGYIALLTDDAVLMPPDSPALTTKNEIRSWSQQFADQFNVESYIPVDHELVLAGDWAFRRSSATFVLRPRSGGDAFAQRGKFIIIYHRQPDGSWKIARDIFNFNGS